MAKRVETALACLALLAALEVAAAALPPGYEDELFCPPGACLKKKPAKPGLVGPRTLFWECVSMADSTEVCCVSSPRPSPALSVSSPLVAVARSVPLSGGRDGRRERAAVASSLQSRHRDV